MTRAATMPRPDQAYRTAGQVRNDTPRAPVHQVLRASFSHNLGHIYEARCGDTLTAAAGAILTTRAVDCPGCLPGWKVKP